MNEKDEENEGKKFAEGAKRKTKRREKNLCFHFHTHNKADKTHKTHTQSRAMASSLQGTNVVLLGHLSKSAYEWKSLVKKHGGVVSQLVSGKVQREKKKKAIERETDVRRDPGTKR